MNNAVDRLSGFPSPLLDHILSFLPTKNVVRTCVLSKVGEMFGVLFHLFILMMGIFLVSTQDFVKCVDSALFLRDGSTIRKLHLIIGSKADDYTLCRVNKWIIYAIRHNVEVLDMILNLPWRSTFELTSQIFTCKSLRELRLTSYQRRVMLPMSCWLPCLKFLHLSSIRFMDMEMTTFESSAFPSLETLIMHDCMFQSFNLHISVPQLKTLHVEGLRCDDMFEISADLDTPNLIFLKLEDTNEKVVFVKFNAISLVNADINLCQRNFGSLYKLTRVLVTVRSLTLHVGNFMTKYDMSILACIQTPFYNMKWLKIETSFSDGDIGMINTLLKHSTKLETLFLEHKPVRTTSEHCFKEEEVWFQYKLPHLKLVEIQGFGGSRNEVKLAKFILEHAIVLEKLIITTSMAQDKQLELLGSEHKVASTVYPKQLERTGRNLINSPRASQSVSILFI